MSPALPFSMSRPLPIGLHLDGETVSLAQLVVQNGRPTYVATAAGDLPADPADIAGAAAMLRRLVADHRFSGRTVVSSLPPRDMTIQNVRLPQVPDEELPPLLRWEAQERLPYPPEEAEIRHLGGGIVREEGVTKQEVILLASRRDAVDRHLALLDGAGLTPAAIDLAGCGMVRCVTTADALAAAGPAESSRRAYLYLGAAAATVLVASGGKVMFLKHLACGGRHLDQSLAKATGLPESEAAAMRRAVFRAAALDARDDLHRTVIDALRIALEALATDVELCLRHVKVSFRGSAPERLAATGPEAATWLAEFLSDRLHLPASVFQPFDAFGRGGAAPDQPARFTVATGLSLRGWARRTSPTATVPA